MAISQKETVKRAVEFRNPEQTPLWFCNRDTEESFVVFTGMVPAPDFAPDVPGRTEWGYIVDSLDETMGQPTYCPLEESVEAIESFVPPNANIPERYQYIKPAIDANPDKYMVANLGISGFNMATFIRGFEGFLEDIYIDEENANRLLDMVFGFEEDVIRNYCKYDIDAVSFFDDWGTQKSLMINPEKWREMFKPRYKKQFDIIHAAGKHVLFHCCGQISEIIDDFIEIGADILNLNQPDLFGIENMKEKYGGRVCFCCPVDHQTVAITGTDTEIFQYVDRLNSNLNSSSGGYIGYVEEYHTCGMTEDGYQSIKKAFLDLNRLKT